MYFFLKKCTRIVPMTTKLTLALLLLYCVITDDYVSRQEIQQTGHVALGCRQDRLIKLAHYFSSSQVEHLKTRTVLNENIPLQPLCIHRKSETVGAEEGCFCIYNSGQLRTKFYMWRKLPLHLNFLVFMTTGSRTCEGGRPDSHKGCNKSELWLRL